MRKQWSSACKKRTGWSVRVLQSITLSLSTPSRTINNHQISLTRKNAMMMQTPTYSPLPRWPTTRYRTALVGYHWRGATGVTSRVTPTTTTTTVTCPQNWATRPPGPSRCCWHRLGTTILIQRVGSWVRNWMGYVVFGRVQVCSLVTPNIFTSQNFLLKVGQRAKWMENSI